MNETLSPTHVPVHRTEVLPPELSSPGRARRVVRQALEEAGHEEWSDAAELACTEVVSNAVLHAHTELTVTVVVTPQRVRVEVRDLNPSLPMQRDYDEQATTGRGMALVAVVTSAHGVLDAGPGGKTVWFEVDDSVVEQSEEELLAGWADAEWDLEGLDGAGAPASPETRTVVLRDMPPTLWLAARQHHDALMREFVLYLASHPEVQVDVAAADAARGRISNAVWAAVQQAQADGTAASVLPDGHPSPLPWVPQPFDLHLDVPTQVASSYAALQDALDTAEHLAARGELLCRPGLPEVVAVRDWACEQVIAQLSGAPSSPWPGTDLERFEVASSPEEDDLDPERWDLTEVDTSTRGVVAADDANRIVGVSDPLLALLGWERDDLVGRRVVALVPPSLREAHVAGFSRHLSTGDAHVLGVPLSLPVLRVDGTEVTCSFLIERRASSQGRAVYVAWIEAEEQPAG